MNTMDYFFSTKGNIERLPFLGLLVMSVVFSFIATLFTALFSKLTGHNNLLFFPVTAIFMYASYCIYMKRFNDIGKMHQLVNIHFAALSFSFLLIIFEIINIFTISIITLNMFFGLVVLGIALFTKSGTPITVEYEGRKISLLKSLLTQVNNKFVPNFETTGMLVMIGGGNELIMTKQEYERRQHILEYADNLYVFHLKDLE